MAHRKNWYRSQFEVDEKNSIFVKT